MKPISERDLYILKDYLHSLEDDLYDTYAVTEMLEIIEEVLASKDIDDANCEGAVYSPDGLGIPDTEW